MASDFFDVGAAQGGARGVVRTDGFPGVAEARHIARQNPRADMDVGAGLVEIALTDAVGGQCRQPRGIDLHETDIAGAIGVAAYGLRIQAGLGARNRVEQRAADLVATCSVFPAGLCRKRCAQCEGQAQSQRRCFHPLSRQCSSPHLISARIDAMTRIGRDGS